MAIPRQKKLLLPIFFFSGFAALVYEVIWARMLSLVFGSTVEAVSAVVAAFMAGLALGSYFMGKWVDRRDNILSIYSLTEIGIGASSLFLYYLIIYLPEILTNTKTEFITSHSYSMYILEFSLVFIPTTLMGATFPLMVRSYVSSRNYVGEGISLIYTVNTLGAVLGAFCTGFFLIPFLGMRMTAATAVTINILLALTLYIINLFHHDSLAPALPYDNQGGCDPKAAPFMSNPPVLVALSVLFVLTLSGFSSLAYQVAWTRVLTMVIGNTVYAFTTILTTFLAGITIGSFVFIRRIDGVKDKLLLLGVLQLLLCISVIGMIPMMDSLPLLFLKLFRILPENFVGTVLIEFIVTFTVILVPAILMGAAFPIAARAYIRMVDKIGEGLGMLYSANTVGAIFGSFLTGFIFIPGLGVQKTILLMSALNLISSIILIFQAETVKKNGGLQFRQSRLSFSCISPPASTHGIKIS